MTTPVNDARSYGCTFGCGNPYDFIIVTVADGTTEFLCVPCYIKLASDMIEAMTNPDNPEVRAAMQLAAETSGNQAPGPQGKRRGHNAPATTDDPALYAAYDGTVTVDELPPEFR